jgi:hypothetical protein
MPEPLEIKGKGQQQTYLSSHIRDIIVGEGETPGETAGGGGADRGVPVRVPELL